MFTKLRNSKTLRLIYKNDNLQVKSRKLQYHLPPFKVTTQETNKINKSCYAS